MCVPASLVKSEVSALASQSSMLIQSTEELIKTVVKV